MRLVAGPEIEGVQHERQHAPVVRAVGVVDHRLQVAPVDRPGVLPFRHQVAQGLLVHDREHHVAHGAVWLGKAGGGQLEQQRGLAGHALEVAHQLVLDPPLRLGADAMHGGDQQVGEAVGDLAPTHMAEGGEQHEPEDVRMPAQLVQFLGPDPAPVGQQHARGHAVEQIWRQGEGTEAPELGRFLVHDSEAGRSGAGPQRQ